MLNTVEIDITASWTVGLLIAGGSDQPKQQKKVHARFNLTRKKSTNNFQVNKRTFPWLLHKRGSIMRLSRLRSYVEPPAEGGAGSDWMDASHLPLIIKCI